MSEGRYASPEAGIRDFDTASLVEIAVVRELFSGAEAYFNHPVKARPRIGTTHHVHGVRHFVIDHEAELRKVLGETGGQDILVHVRLATPEAGAIYDLSAKLGAQPQSCVELLKAIRAEGLRAADTAEGDWVEIGDIGTYSNALATRFNGFHPETFVEIDGP